MENKDLNQEQDPENEEDEVEGESKDKSKNNQKLINAVKLGEYDTCKRLIDKKANIFQEDTKKKWTPLVWAAVKNHINIVKLLLSKGAASIYLSNSATININTLNATNTNLNSSNNLLSNNANNNATNNTNNNTANNNTNPNTNSSPNNNPNPNSPNNNQSPANQETANLYLNPQKCTMGIINNVIKQTPLQWATFKGHTQIIWLLLKEGMHWEDVDAFGNNCVHLAASNGTLQIFQIYMMIGVDIYCKNSRGHEAIDLATNQQIIDLIKAYKACSKCKSCHKEIENCKKHWCCTCNDFFCPECYKLEWVWETPESTEKEKLDGKCKKCWDVIAKATQELQEKMKLYDHTQLTQKINEIDGKPAQKVGEESQGGSSLMASSIACKPIEIDLKLKKEAIVLQEKLRTQNIILDKIASLKVVENYKTILKSVNQLKEMKEDAKNRNVDIDKDVIDKLDETMERLVAERNLRFQLDNIDVGNCFVADVNELQRLMDIATNKHVDECYMNKAKELNSKMSRSIQTKDICQLFSEYPERTDKYVPVVLDFKTKKPIDPTTKKPVDIKTLLAPKKKKKKGKEPKFTIPEWANELPALDKQIKAIEGLLKDSAELELKPDFIQKANEQILRMKTELKYRKALDEEQKIINDLRQAMKNKKK